MAQMAIAIGLAVANLIVGAQHLGAWQSLESALYHRSIDRQPAQPPDLRLLIVAISETDVQRLGR